MVDWREIIRFLHKLCAIGRSEVERQQRVIDTLAEFPQQVPDPAGICISTRGVKKAMLEATVSGLPAGIELAPGGARVGRLADEDVVRLNRAVLVFLGIAAPRESE